MVIAASGMRKRLAIAPLAVLSMWATAHGTEVHEAGKIDIQQKIEALAGDATFSQAIVGICARKADGTPLVDINAKTMLMPASNMKLITTGAALHEL